MKKILIIVFIFALTILTPQNFVVSASNKSATYIVCGNSATLFESASLTSTKITQLSHKDEILVEMEGESVAEYSSNGFVFYKATFQSQEGFVLSDLVVPAQKLISSIPNFNAKTNKDSVVYLQNDNSFEESSISLAKNTEIFLYEGFDDKTDYTAIAFIYENQVRYGYLQSDDINPDGINPFIITAIIVIVALVGVIFALVFMRRKKVDLKKKKIVIKD